MKNYLTEIVWESPYPKRFSYRIKASSIATGVARAMRMFRTENKGKKIKKVAVKIEQL